MDINEIKTMKVKTTNKLSLFTAGFLIGVIVTWLLGHYFIIKPLLEQVIK